MVAACRQCRTYVRRHLIKTKLGLVYRMSDEYNVAQVYEDKVCTRCGLFVCQIPGVINVQSAPQEKQLDSEESTYTVMRKEAERIQKLRMDRCGMTEIPPMPEDQDWFRASGLAICQECGQTYLQHPEDPEKPPLVVLCSGLRVKL